MISTRSYFIWLTASCSLFLGIFGTINYIVDPYNFFQTVAIQGFNLSKPAASDRMGFTKSYMVNKIKANTLLVGASELDVGLDPESAIWPESYKPVFNLGVPGSTQYKRFRLIQHAVSKHKPKTILLAIDFSTFLLTEDNGVYPPAELDFEKRLNVTYSGVPNSNVTIQYLKDASASTLSIDALVDSFNTVINQKILWLSPSGFSSAAARFGPEVLSKGYYSIFRDTLRQHAELINGRHIYENSEPFKAFEDIINFCVNQNIDLVLMIPPAHAFTFEVWRMSNLWPEYESWKKLILQKVKSVQENNSASSSTITIWDFARYSTPIIENVPAANDRTHVMNWFWESVHFKPELGELMLSEMFDNKESIIGEKINFDNLCSNIMSLRQEQENYRKNNPAQLELLESMNTISATDVVQYNNSQNIEPVCSSD